MFRPLRIWCVETLVNDGCALGGTGGSFGVSGITSAPVHSVGEHVRTVSRHYADGETQASQMRGKGTADLARPENDMEFSSRVSAEPYLSWTIAFILVTGTGLVEGRVHTRSIAPARCSHPDTKVWLGVLLECCSGRSRERCRILSRRTAFELEDRHGRIARYIFIAGHVAGANHHLCNAGWTVLVGQTQLAGACGSFGARLDLEFAEDLPIVSFYRVPELYPNEMQQRQ